MPTRRWRRACAWWAKAPTCSTSAASRPAPATFLNDIWGLTRSPAIAGLAARHGCALVLMHNQDGTEYAGDLMAEIKRFLRASVDVAVSAGVPRERILIDPGIG